MISRASLTEVRSRKGTESDLEIIEVLSEKNGADDDVML